jgi:hypothetical protein
VLVGGGWQWVLGWSKAANAACLAAFGPSTDSALSRQPECVKKYHMALYDPPSLRLWRDRQTCVRSRASRRAQGTCVPRDRACAAACSRACVRCGVLRCAAPQARTRVCRSSTPWTRSSTQSRWRYVLNPSYQIRVTVPRALSLIARQVEAANTIIRVDSLPVVHVAEVKPAWAPD